MSSKVTAAAAAVVALLSYTFKRTVGLSKKSSVQPGARRKLQTPLFIFWRSAPKKQFNSRAS